MARTLDIDLINANLKGKHPGEIIAWALRQGQAIVTTNFGPYEAVILHLVSRIDPDIPVVWVDSGFNTPATYQFAEDMKERLKLNLHVYAPSMTAKRIEVLMGGIPEVDNEQHAEFTRLVKLDPFTRAMGELEPQVWMTAIRRSQTPFRQSLDIVTHTEAGILKIAPLFYWTEEDLERYLREFDLPNETDYFDPTKALAHRECGLHTAL